MAISRRRFSAGLSAILTLPGLIGRASAQGATIKVGMCAPVTGPAAESGRYAQIGAKLAVDAVNKAGGVLGKQVELIVEDDQTTNPGGVAALQKLLEDKEIPVILSSIRSTQVQAMLPTINEAKIPWGSAGPTTDSPIAAVSGSSGSGPTMA